MKKSLFTLVFLTCVLNIGNIAQAQIYYGSPPAEITVFTFVAPDSLHRNFNFWFSANPVYIDTSHSDTTNTYLWEIGNTHKAYFADTGTATGIMTDTLNTYPVNVNSWFVLKYFPVTNEIISFRHKYQTTAHHDGGMVEFSVDSGHTWQNVIGNCNGIVPGINFANFYALTDTLLSGEPAFNGADTGWTTSKIQFFWGNAAKPNGGPACAIDPFSNIQLRFRFKSDSIPDTLAGWIIGDIGIEQDLYLGIPKINKLLALDIYPNPSLDAVFNFPALDEEKTYSIELINALGRRVLQMPYQRQINLSQFSKGLYFYRVTNGTQYYSGKLVVE